MTDVLPQHALTSDTNTTVTLPTGVEFCVTVLGVAIEQDQPVNHNATVSYYHNCTVLAVLQLMYV